MGRTTGHSGVNEPSGAVLPCGREMSARRKREVQVRTGSETVYSQSERRFLLPYAFSKDCEPVRTNVPQELRRDGRGNGLPVVAQRAMKTRLRDVSGLLALILRRPSLRLGASTFEKIFRSIKRAVLRAQLRQRIRFNRIDDLVC